MIPAALMIMTAEAAAPKAVARSPADKLLARNLAGLLQAIRKHSPKAKILHGRRRPARRRPVRGKKAMKKGRKVRKPIRKIVRKGRLEEGALFM